MTVVVVVGSTLLPMMVYIRDAKVNQKRLKHDIYELLMHHASPPAPKGYALVVHRMIACLFNACPVIQSCARFQCSSTVEVYEDNPDLGFFCWFSRRLGLLLIQQGRHNRIAASILLHDELS